MKGRHGVVEWMCCYGLNGYGAETLLTSRLLRYFKCKNSIGDSFHSTARMRYQKYLIISCIDNACSAITIHINKLQRPLFMGFKETACLTQLPNLVDLFLNHTGFCRATSVPKCNSHPIYFGVPLITAPKLNTNSVRNTPFLYRTCLKF